MNNADIIAVIQAFERDGRVLFREPDEEWEETLHPVWNFERYEYAPIDHSPRFIPRAEPPIPNQERVAACVVACNGIETAQLEAMNAHEPGLLARAYDVCSDLWGWFGTELIGDHPINGAEAVNALRHSADDIEAVVHWAHEKGEKQ